VDRFNGASLVGLSVALLTMNAGVPRPLGLVLALGSVAAFAYVVVPFVLLPLGRGVERVLKRAGAQINEPPPDC
jgi:hypothetical protein